MPDDFVTEAEEFLIDDAIDAMDAAYDQGREDLANQALELVRQMAEEEDLDRDDIIEALEEFFEAELGAELVDEDFDEQEVLDEADEYLLAAA